MVIGSDPTATNAKVSLNLTTTGSVPCDPDPQEAKVRVIAIVRTATAISFMTTFETVGGHAASRFENVNAVAWKISNLCESTDTVRLMLCDCPHAPCGTSIVCGGRAHVGPLRFRWLFDGRVEMDSLGLFRSHSFQRLPFFELILYPIQSRKARLHGQECAAVPIFVNDSEVRGRRFQFLLGRIRNRKIVPHVL